MNKKKLCIVTGTRAEYGLLYYLMKGIDKEDDCELQIVVTGMHLSPEFGMTYKLIEQDNFFINYKVEMLLSSDTSVGISKSVGLAISGFADAFSMLNPDIVIVLGDRFETFAAASSATFAKIPIAHIHGGETTEGVYDEAMRHSITKMAHLHFTATEEYRKRVIQLGEHPERVFNIGAIGIDNIKRLNLLSRIEFENSIKFKLGKQNLLITFHPVTLEESTTQEQFVNILNALDKLDETHLIFTKANADNEGRIINRLIDNYINLHTNKAISYTSLGQLRYLSALKFVNGVVGNSSSGLIEVPSFRKGTINIGDRQRGRVKAESVIDCLPIEKDIEVALKKLFSYSFQKNLKSVINPYDGGAGASEKIVNVIRRWPLQGILKKRFFDTINEIQ